MILGLAVRFERVMPRCLRSITPGAPGPQGYCWPRRSACGGMEASIDGTVVMDMPEFFAKVEATLLAKFQMAGAIAHAGDKGENREEILRDFLARHLPGRYGITKGHVVTRDGSLSHSADIIIYDSLVAPFYIRRALRLFLSRVSTGLSK